MFTVGIASRECKKLEVNIICISLIPIPSRSPANITREYNIFIQQKAGTSSRFYDVMMMSGGRTSLT